MSPNVLEFYSYHTMYLSRKRWYKSCLADKSWVDGSRLPEVAPVAGVAGAGAAPNDMISGPVAAPVGRDPPPRTTPDCR